ncbi:MAG: DUF4280 domain-containing protein [Anaerolineales bacterium]|nr:DUF4280 domain-containing protein [Anaerolineales bacterium]
MAQQVVNGATLMCTFGTAPSTMIVTPENMINAAGQPAATIMDYIPMKNIMPFLMCTTPSNPAVAAAQGAPVPCMPVTTAPWFPGSPTVMLSKKVALNSTSKCMCMWGGVISVQMAGQMTVNIP